MQLRRAAETVLLCSHPFYRGGARHLAPRHVHKPGALLVLKGVKLHPSTPHPRDRGEVLAQVKRVFPRVALRSALQAIVLWSTLIPEASKIPRNVLLFTFCCLLLAVYRCRVRAASSGLLCCCSPCAFAAPLSSMQNASFTLPHRRRTAGDEELPPPPPVSPPRSRGSTSTPSALPG